MSEEVYAITRIFDKRTINKKVEYMVAFKGFHIGLSEWVPAEHLKECQDEIDYYEAKIKGIKQERINVLGRPSKFANDYDFIRLKGKMSKEHYKAYQMKDEFESESDYEELKRDYLEARRQMELEEERKQLIEVNANSNKNDGGNKKGSKYKKNISKKKVVVAFEVKGKSDRESAVVENSSIFNVLDKKNRGKISSSKSDSIEIKVSSDDDNDITEQFENSGIDTNVNSDDGEFGYTQLNQNLSKKSSGKVPSTSREKECNLKTLDSERIITRNFKKSLRSNGKIRTNRLRLESSESDSDMEIDMINNKRMFIEDFVKPMEGSHKINLENFLTFVEVYVHKNSKLIIFLTKDRQYLMINENEIPDEMDDNYKNFLLKKGLLDQQQ